MKIFFLGTGAAEGVPALFCDCAVCSRCRRQGGADLRLRASVLVDGVIRIDLPPDTLAQVHAYPSLLLCDITHLHFTHSHDDHFAARELQYLSPNFAPCRARTLGIWGTQYLLDRVQTTMGKFFEPAPLSLRAVEPFRTYRVAHLDVTPISAHHKKDELCLNYLLTDPRSGKTILYASDTGWYNGATWDFLAGRRLDAVVLECGLGELENGYDGHLSLAGCVSVKEKLVGGGGLAVGAPFYLTHISHTGMLDHAELSERAAPHGIRVAYDGLDLCV